MSSVPSNLSAPITAEQFAAMTDIDDPVELVRGRIQFMSRPGFRHALICAWIAYLLRRHLVDHDVGRVLADTGVVTKRGPDSVRGPDVAYYSYERVPRDVVPVKWADVSPDLVFEVRSPDDRWKDMLVKVAEYVSADVQCVCILDPDAETAHLFRADEPVRVCSAAEEIAFAPALPDWRVRVKQFFEAR